MDFKQLFVSIAIAVTANAALAGPVANLTFSVDFRGYTASQGVRTYLPGPAISEKVTVQLPYFVRDTQVYEDSYASHYFLNLGTSEPSAGLRIVSTSIESLFSTSLTDPFVNQALIDLGLTNQQTSLNLHPRDYAFIGKRDIHAHQPEQRFLTWLDATIMGPSETLSGAFDAELVSMIRLSGMRFGAEGNVDAFEISDVDEMLRDIASSGQPGFEILYTRSIDSYTMTNNALSWTGRPFEITYGGNARLESFTVDGVDLLNPVPEPQALSLFLLGVIALVIATRTCRARQRAALPLEERRVVSQSSLLIRKM